MWSGVQLNETKNMIFTLSFRYGAVRLGEGGGAENGLRADTFGVDFLRGKYWQQLKEKKDCSFGMGVSPAMGSKKRACVTTVSTCAGDMTTKGQPHGVNTRSAATRSTQRPVFSRFSVFRKTHRSWGAARGGHVEHRPAGHTPEN